MIEATANINNSELAFRANEFINHVFWGSMLREFRNSRSTTIFDDGLGHDTFIRQLDAELIKRMNDSSRLGLADALIRQLGNRHGVSEEIRTATNDFDRIQITANRQAALGRANG